MTQVSLSDFAPVAAEIALRNVDTEYPNAPQYLLRGPADLTPPRRLHPMFFGSYDWHSSVHMHWLLVRLLGVVDPATRRRIESRLDAAFLPPAPNVEAAYLRSYPGFERPYGWAWALMLAAAVHDERETPAAARWARDLTPLVDTIDSLAGHWLRTAAGPVRHGVHHNTAFALGVMIEAARSLGRGELVELIDSRSRQWFLADRDYPVGWEPSGQDFLSAALTEADLMRLVLDDTRYLEWLENFLPELRHGDITTLRPAEVHDAEDGQQSHLHGLNLSRAAHLYRLSRALPPSHPAVEALRARADQHLDAGLGNVGGGFVHEHWLATYAYLALCERDAVRTGL